MDVSSLLAMLALVAGIVGGLTAAWVGFSKDRREQRQEPITQRDALLTQSGAAMSRILDRMAKTEDARDEDRARLDKLDAQLTHERHARGLIERELDQLRIAVHRWTEFGEWLHDQWAVVRLKEVPPPLPAGLRREGNRGGIPAEDR